MPEWVISGGVGSLLIGMGAALIAGHFRAWGRQQQSDGALDEHDLRHYRLQFRRRVQTSAMIVVLGIMIPIGDLLIPWQRFPKLFSLYWIVVLLLAFWIMILAAFDWLSSRVYSRRTNAALAKLRQKQRELEAEADRLRGIRAADGRGIFDE